MTYNKVFSGSTQSEAFGKVPTKWKKKYIFHKNRQEKYEKLGQFAKAKGEHDIASFGRVGDYEGRYELHIGKRSDALKSRKRFSKFIRR
jgi:hypothetical protein